MLTSLLKLGSRLACLAALTMIFAVSARTQGTEITPDPYQKSKEAVYLTPQPDRALLYVARPDYARVIGLSDFKVFIDDQTAGWLPQRSYLAMQVEPGRRLLWGPSRNEVLRFNFEAGKTYLLILNEIYTRVGNSSMLDRTWWSERDAEEIKGLVAAGKLAYVTTEEGQMAELGKEAAKKYAKTNEKTKDVVEFSLPASFETVWYRPGKKKFMLKPFEATGTLTISSETIEYKGDKKSLVIRLKDVKKVSLGQFVSFGLDSQDEWNILKFTTDVSEEVVGFRDGHGWGNGGNTGAIYRALLAALQAQAHPSSPESGTAILAGYSASRPANGEAQPVSPPEAEPPNNGENHPVAASALGPAVTQGSTAPAPQPGTLGSPLLQQDTLRMISLLDGDQGCTAARRVLKMEISKPPVGVKVKHNRAVSGWWEEHWTIDRCGKPVNYYITYRNDSKGEVDFDVAYRPDGPAPTETTPGAGQEPGAAQQKDQEKKAEADAPQSPAATATTPAAATSSQPAAAGALPDGFVLFEGRKDQFTIAIPRDWTVYDQARMLEEIGTQRMKDNAFNMIIFYRSVGASSKNDMSPEVLLQIDSGNVPAFFVQKLKAGDGMSCAGFSEKAQKQVLKLVSSESAFAKGATVTEAPHAEPSQVAGCTGVRVQGSGQSRQSSSPTRHDVYAASDGVVLYLFSLRSPAVAEKPAPNVEVFQKSMATARLAAAK